MNSEDALSSSNLLKENNVIKQINNDNLINKEEQILSSLEKKCNIDSNSNDCLNQDEQIKKKENLNLEIDRDNLCIETLKPSDRESCLKKVDDVINDDHHNKHWPEAYFTDSFQKDVQQIDAPDIITMDDCLSSFKFTEMSNKEIWKMIDEWAQIKKKFIDNHDDIRIPAAHKSNGKKPEKDILMKKIRAIAREVVYNIGKKLLSGNFNLTTVPFPIKAMVPKSQLEAVVLSTCYYPLYLNLAAKSQDPIQRFKYYIIAAISYYYLTNSFAKPLNPILGETLHGYYNDGSRVYLEQTSHHPPISYILMYGPNNSYKCYGPSIFAASAGLNSLTITVKGWRRCEFNDPPQEIYNTFPNEAYDGTFLGQLTHETIGSMEFIDKQNLISCEIKFGKNKKKPTDYLEGDIKVDGKVISTITGTYLGWLEIDGQRYFDYRYIIPFKFVAEKSRLGSDFAYRPDLCALKIGEINKAQEAKEHLEHVQRTDAKLRKAYKESLEKK